MGRAVKHHSMRAETRTLLGEENSLETAQRESRPRPGAAMPSTTARAHSDATATGAIEEIKRYMARVYECGTHPWHPKNQRVKYRQAEAFLSNSIEHLLISKGDLIITSINQP